MRFLTFLLAACCGTALSAQQFPMRLPVATAGTAVFSGPAATHYQTDQLAAGTVVEIYRLDPDNWCAIRPPPGSFCLVRASAVEPASDGSPMGDVVEGGAKCWVGTLLGEVTEPIWQVKLRAGERVRLLGEVPANRGDSNSVGWLHIEPPSGEFRWVPLEYFSPADRQQIVEAARDDAPEIQLASGEQEFEPSSHGRSGGGRPSELTSDDDRESLELLAEDFSETQLAPPSDSNQPRGSRPKRHTEVAGGRDGGSWQPARRPIAQVAAQVAEDPWAQTPTIVNSPPIPSRAASRASANSLPVLQPEIAVDWAWPVELQRLDLQLSTAVLEEPGRWDLETLNRAVLQSRTRLTSPSDLAIADHLLNKIRRFQEIRNAQLQTSNTIAAVPTANRNNPPAVLGFSGRQPVLDQRPLDVPANLGTAIQNGTQFDAHGYLNELVREGGNGQTSFVLQDENGKITHLITPAPGVNLHRYLKSQVGLIGQKGFHKQFQLDHVTAERVVRLDSLQR